jgi:hypothetical protein
VNIRVNIWLLFGKVESQFDNKTLYLIVVEVLPLSKENKEMDILAPSYYWKGGWMLLVLRTIALSQRTSQRIFTD